MKTIITGAGATYGSSVTHEKIKPPLLFELPKILKSQLIQLNRSPDGPAFSKGFYELVEVAKLEDDIETFFTIIHILGIIACRIDNKNVFINDKQINDLINSGLLEKEFMSSKLVEISKYILMYYSSHKLEALMTYPYNMQNLYQPSLREYFYHALTNCFCIYHELLFKDLDSNDTVVNFNYDEICDFTLFSLNKLSSKSFVNLPFSSISFPKPHRDDCANVKYLKVHGSFNWWMNLGYPEVFYDLISEACDRRPTGNTSFPIVLPTLTKKIIYNEYPIYSSHIYEFSKSIENCDEILLVGKTFKNADNELNYIIQQQRKKKKCSLTIIDPNTKDEKFNYFHSDLFNANNMNTYGTLKEYYEKNL